MRAQPSAAAAATTRLFLALWPGPAALRILAGWQARWAWPEGAAVVPPERLHLTLHFIGPVAAERLPELVHALAVPVPRFNLVFDQVQQWPRGLAVLCPRALPEALLALHAQLQAALRSLALPVDARAYRPHVTLARKAAGAQAPADMPALRWPVSGYALVQSLNGYHTLQHYR